MEKKRVRDKAKRKASNDKWLKANPEKAKAAGAAWRKANPEKVRKIISDWYAKNKNAQRDHRQNRRARVKGAEGTLSDGLSDKLFALQKGKCPCCKQPLGDKYHMDHIMPIALGGANSDSNMQLLRSICNQQKHAKNPVDFMQERGFLL